MGYLYKPKNKYPHVVYLMGIRPGNIAVLTEVRDWTNENIGSYCEAWFCPAKSDYDGNIGWPYAFKTLEDAFTFKMRWALG